LPLKLFVFDRQTILITEKSPLSSNGELTMTIIKQKTTVEGYVTLFDFMWDQAMPLEKWVSKNSSLLKKKLQEWETSTNK
jgi:hypothetical protein